MTWSLTAEHTTAREAAALRAANAQSIASADVGSGPSTLALYTEEGGVLLATIILAKPCGVIDAATGRIALKQASATGDLIAATGLPTFAQWRTGSGANHGSCSVSANGGDGDIKVNGRDDGMVFQGGYITLLEGLIG